MISVKRIISTVLALFAISALALAEALPWALPKLSVVNMREQPKHSAELVSQALMGMPLRVLETESDWYKVESPEGYIGWVTASSLALKSDNEMSEWRKSRRVIVTAPHQIYSYTDSCSEDSRHIATDLVLGDIAQLISRKINTNDRVKIILPDGRQAWVASRDVQLLKDWASQRFDAAKILDTAYSMMGQPYLWGGTSAKGVDCSGLVKVAYLANGLILRRDASQQALTGQLINSKDWHDYKAGDLLFFGNAENSAVTHVAIYDRDGKFIHSSGRVKINSLDPESQLYMRRPLLFGTRIAGSESTDGITRLAKHPWYF